MKGIVLQNHHVAYNDYSYTEGQEVDVTELEQFKDSYVIYYDETLDWIPKKIVQII